MNFPSLHTVSEREITLQTDVVVDHMFGKKKVNLPNKKKKKKRGEEALTVWKKRNIFFTLPY